MTCEIASPSYAIGSCECASLLYHFGTRLRVDVCECWALISEQHHGVGYTRKHQAFRAIARSRERSGRRRSPQGSSGRGNEETTQFPAPSCITAIVRSMISPGGMSALLNTDPFSAAGRGLPLTAANKPLEHNGRGALPIPWPPTTYRQVSLRVAIFRVASSGSLVTTKPSSRSI
jgi:hypothetical protein